MLSTVLIASMAMCALAAPTPKAAMEKRSFSVAVQARRALYRSPQEEIVRTFGKYGWEIVLPYPYDNPWSYPYGGGYGGESSPSSTAAAPAATSTAAATTPYNNGTSDANRQSAVGTGTATATAAGSTSTSTSGETGEVTASPESVQSEYLETVSIGGQALSLDFDTGSSDL